MKCVFSTSTFLLSCTLLVVSPRFNDASLRGEMSPRELATVVDLPSISVNVNEDGGVSVSTPWGSVNTDGNGTSVHGFTPTSIGNVTCANLGPWDTAAEPTCETALPAFYESTTTFAGTSKPKIRKITMDTFCTTPCGDTWTRAVFAHSLRCSPGVGGNGSAAGGVVVDVPGAAVSTGPGGSVDVQAPGTTVTRDPGTGAVQVEFPGGRVHAGNGSVAVASAASPAQTARTPAATTSGGPAFPVDYPGLRLGCIKDPKDEEFCAVKRAAVPGVGGDAEDGGPACDFYLSCCYAQYVQTFGSVPTEFMEEVEAACPGSTAFLQGSVCTA